MVSFCLSPPKFDGCFAVGGDDDLHIFNKPIIELFFLCGAHVGTSGAKGFLQDVLNIKVERFIQCPEPYF